MYGASRSNFPINHLTRGWQGGEMVRKAGTERESCKSERTVSKIGWYQEQGIEGNAFVLTSLHGECSRSKDCVQIARICLFFYFPVWGNEQKIWLGVTIKRSSNFSFPFLWLGHLKFERFAFDYFYSKFCLCELTEMRRTRACSSVVLSSFVRRPAENLVKNENRTFEDFFYFRIFITRISFLSKS